MSKLIENYEKRLIFVLLSVIIKQRQDNNDIFPLI